MAERPILFSGPMVRAILAGKKTETRRIVKPSNTEGIYNKKSLDILWNEGTVGDPGCIWLPMKHPNDSWDDFDEGAAEAKFFSRVKPGDLLWVKETWGSWEKFGDPVAKDKDQVQYLADESAFVPDNGWRPSIFMPRWASRITLRVVSVHAERLQDITEEGAIAEGVRGPAETPLCIDDCRTAFGRYRELWDEINGKGSWALNPWVWVIKFEPQNDLEKINSGGTE